MSIRNSGERVLLLPLLLTQSVHLLLLAAEAVLFWLGGTDEEFPIALKRPVNRTYINPDAGELLALLLQT
jgi:hypothetical protein